MTEEQPEGNVSPEARALSSIALQLQELRRQMSRRDQPSLIKRMREYPKEQREDERHRLEVKQARLYRLIVIFAAVSALASVASVVVAILSG